MFSLVVCNSTQGNGVFLGGSQQHSRKVAYFLGGRVEPPMIYISLAVYYNLQGNDKFLGGWILALKKILDPQEISILV